MYSDYLAKLFFVMAQWVHLKLRSGSTSATLASVYSPVTCIYVLSLVKDINAWKCKDNFFFWRLQRYFCCHFVGVCLFLFQLLVTVIAADEETETFFFKILCGKTTHTRKVFDSEVATGIFTETRSLQFQTKTVLLTRKGMKIDLPWKQASSDSHCGLSLL